MRNLIEYPITSDEVLAALDSAQKRESNTQGIGGINAWALNLAMQYFKQNKDELSEFLVDQQKMEGI